jgi:hypothetical protein
MRPTATRSSVRLAGETVDGSARATVADVTHLESLMDAVAQRVDWARVRLETEPPGDAQTWLRRYEMDCAALVYELRRAMRRADLSDARLVDWLIKLDDHWRAAKELAGTLTAHLDADDAGGLAGKPETRQ